jgi:hypothetical protein
MMFMLYVKYAHRMVLVLHGLNPVHFRTRLHVALMQVEQHFLLLKRMWCKLFANLFQIIQRLNMEYENVGGLRRP